MTQDRQFNQAVLVVELHDLLKRLGIAQNYIGFSQTISAVKLSVENPALLSHVTKDLYPSVAEHHNTNWRAVERNIRTVVSQAWMTNPALLSALTGFPLHSRPRPSYFVAILSAYCSNNRAVQAPLF